MAGSARMARVIERSWRWPWLRLPARSERLVCVALRELADEVVGLGHPGRLDALLVGGLEAAVADVLHDRVREEEGVLEHEAEVAAQVGLAHARGCPCRRCVMLPAWIS